MGDGTVPNQLLAVPASRGERANKRPGGSAPSNDFPPGGSEPFKNRLGALFLLLEAAHSVGKTG
jgi:hypothetical protein